MAFAFQLQDSLRYRDSQIALEFAAGESLESILSRYLIAVETSADTQLLTSILLLDEEGKHLWHGAAPSLPRSYCEAIDGSPIGPQAGSCGTAAYRGEAVYVTDVEEDPLWTDYKELAREYGLRACWSTPIRSAGGAMLGTFAVYHLTPRGPTSDETNAIRLITGHVASAIEWAQGRQDIKEAYATNNAEKAVKAYPTLVSSNDETAGAAPSDHDQAHSIQLELYAANFERYAGMVTSPALSNALETVARDCRDLVDVFRRARKIGSLKDRFD